MLSKNKIKFINTLKKKKTRNEKGLFIAEGEKIVKEIIYSSLDVEILCATDRLTETLSENHKSGIAEIIAVNDKELSKISSLKTPNEALAVVRQPSFHFESKTIQSTLSLALDRINDPGNLGTIIRIADWFGIENIFCTPDSVDVFNPKAVQATMGAICRVKIHYLDLNKFIGEMTEQYQYPVYGTFLEGDNIYNKKLTSTGLIVLGSESHGISDELTPHITDKLYIPNFSTNSAFTTESLNVSVATAIVCSEFKRRMI